MSWLRVDARLLSVGAPSPSCGVQTEPAHGHDSPIHRLRFFGIHQECDYGEAAAAGFHSHALSLGVAGSAGFLLGIPQHALVSVHVLAAAQELACVLYVIPARLNRNHTSLARLSSLHLPEENRDSNPDQ